MLLGDLVGWYIYRLSSQQLAQDGALLAKWLHLMADVYGWTLSLLFQLVTGAIAAIVSL